MALFAEKEVKRKQLIRNWVIATSLANLCFIGSWNHLLYPPSKGYYLEQVATWSNFAAVMINVLLLTIVFGFSATYVHRLKEHYLILARWTFVIVTLFSINAVRIEVFGPLTFTSVAAQIGKPGTMISFLVTACLLVVVVMRWKGQIIGMAQALILILSPFTIVTFSKATTQVLYNAYSVTASRSNSIDHCLRPQVKSRVVWIIFDELDYRAAFVARPDSVQLPELDRLHAESLFATNAYPPAGMTILSIPSLVSGKRFFRAREIGPSQLALNAVGGETVLWQSQPSVFSRVLAMGGKTGIAGWYHPYCRVLANVLTRCSWNRIASESERYCRGFFKCMVDGFWKSAFSVSLLRPVLPKPIDQNNTKDDYVHFIRRSLDQAKELAVDTSLTLVLIHYPAPHPPCVYDRWKDDYTSTSDCNYLDSLELVDRTLGDLRSSMESAGVWDQTTVLLSSDHWWRTNIWEKEPSWTKEEAHLLADRTDRRVPFMLKLAGPRGELSYNSQFNTVISQDLLLTILRGELSTPQQVAIWLDQHQSSDSYLPTNLPDTAQMGTH
ncbi:MAG TPA: sulfatase-like hydrolase/transferase [Pyrinomonadaceae bacterium]|nr:sulfatase-like hydrolase/transferase [Pyrinomonadaceae bacterium]